MRSFNRYKGFGLATLSGCLWFLACPPFDLSALAWIAAVPMLFAIDRASSLKSALFLGWWAGVVETAGGFYWLIDLMQRFANLPWPAAAAVFFIFCAARALIFLVFTAIVWALRRHRRVPMLLLGPMALAVGELIVPQVFPCGQWISQAWNPLVIQITELTGPIGVTSLLMVVNGALYDLIDRHPHARRGAVVAAAVVAACLLFGAIRMRQVDELVAHAPRLRIGLVQPNFAYTVDGDMSREEMLRELAALQTQSTRLERAGAEFVIWSEGSYPIALPRDLTRDFAPESLGMIRRGFGTPVLIGANTIDSQGNAFNSALLLDQDGNAVDRYDKVRLLAFGEYMPGIETFPSLRNMMPPGVGQFTAGAGPGVMSLQTAGGTTWRLGPVICYEDLLPGFLGQLGRLHPDLLVNLTSDSWFGAQTEPWEHLALSVFATVELRVALVRSVNSGISAMIDPNGRLVAKTYADDPYREPRAADGMVVTAPKMAGGHTLFVAAGNWFAYFCGFVIFGIAMGEHRSRRACRQRVKCTDA